MASYSNLYQDLEGLREMESLSGSQQFQEDEVDVVLSFARALEAHGVPPPTCDTDGGYYKDIELSWSGCDLKYDGLGFTLYRFEDFRVNFPYPLTDMERHILCDLVKCYCTL